MDGTMSLHRFGGSLLDEDGRALPIRDRLAIALRNAVGNIRSPAKTIARLTGRTPKAVDRWLNAENEMTVESLVLLCREFDEVWQEFRALCGREPADAEAMIDRFSEMLRERRKAK